MIEQKIKTLLGEYAFNLTVLQHQLEEVRDELAKLKKLHVEDKPKRS